MIKPECARATPNVARGGHFRSRASVVVRSTLMALPLILLIVAVAAAALSVAVSPEGFFG